VTLSACTTTSERPARYDVGDTVVWNGATAPVWPRLRGKPCKVVRVEDRAHDWYYLVRWDHLASQAPPMMTLRERDLARTN
jgi:hypothetical protein